MDGFQNALLVAAVIAAGGRVVAYVLVRPHDGAGRAPSRRRARAGPVA